MDYECNCRVCNNDDAPEMHEICECYDCHEAGCHEDTVAWSADCSLCDEILVQEAIDARTHDLQKGDSK